MLSIYNTIDKNLHSIKNRKEVNDSIINKSVNRLNKLLNSSCEDQYAHNKKLYRVDHETI